MSASTLFAIPTLAAFATAQQFNNAYPTTTMYGQAGGYQNQMMMGSQFGFGGGFGGYQGGGFGGGYGGNYGRQCRSNVRSEDLQGGFQQCYCDKNHRDEDYCSDGKACDTTYKWDKDYYKDIFDEDCVQQWQKPTNVRRCQSKTKSKDLAGPAVCYCDSNHKKDTDDIEDAERACADNGDVVAADSGNVGHTFIDSDFYYAYHYGNKGNAYAATFNGAFLVNSCSASSEQEVVDALDAFDPNCVERFGGYGGYGGYGQQFGGYGQQYGGYGQQFGGYGGYGQQQMYGGFGQQQQMYGFGGQFGGNMFYPTSMMQPAAAAPVDGAAPAPTFQFQAQQFGGFPQQQMYGGYGGYRQQQGYYGR